MVQTIQAKDILHESLAKIVLFAILDLEGFYLSYRNSVLQWTASAQGNYTKAVVNFRDNGAASRTFTMATNYNQPDEKRCQWEVQEPQQNPEENLSAPSLSQ